jgi:predicted membrane-bound spermidine synthase
MKHSKLVLFLSSLSLISLEITWTRIFSAEFFYTFAFLTLSLAILGMGMGALSARLFKSFGKEKMQGFWLLLSGILTIIGPTLVFLIGIDFSVVFFDIVAVFKFILGIILLFLPYYFAGICFAVIFRSKADELSELYMADMIGAGLGIFFVIILMDTFQTPASSVLISIPLLLSSILLINKHYKILPAAMILIAILYSGYVSENLSANNPERGEKIYEHWDSYSKVKVCKITDDYWNLNIDNVANSPVYRFDGNWDRPDSMKYHFSIDVSYLINMNDSCTFLSLGAGGGTDVLQALQAGADKIYAVEVIPHINDMMANGFLKEFTGEIYNDPRVEVVSEDARAFVRRFRNEFDMIYSLSSNSFAALASGSFALAENYLFTTEAFIDYWNSMTDNGFLMMEHQFYVPRMVSEVINALEILGIDDPKKHFAVYDIPGLRRKIILLSKQKLTPEILENAFGEQDATANDYKYLLYPAADSIKNNMVDNIVEKGWCVMRDSVPSDISPCNDDRPFVAQLGLWKNFEIGKLEKVLPYEFTGFPITKIILVLIIIIVIVLFLPLNFLPYFKKDMHLKAAPWLFFFLIGISFMMVEIVLIQKYALFIGTSIYSIITVLFTMLTIAGIGSRFSGRFSGKVVFSFIIGLLMFDALISRELIYIFEDTDKWLRIVLTFIMISPLSFFMGMPFPKAGKKVGNLIDWGFAINATASVLGGTLVVLISSSYGYTFTLIISALLYLIAYRFFISKSMVRKAE